MPTSCSSMTSSTPRKPWLWSSNMWWGYTLPRWDHTLGPFMGGLQTGLKLVWGSVFSVCPKEKETTVLKGAGVTLVFASSVWLIWPRRLLADWVSVFNTLPSETWAVDILIGVLLFIEHLEDVKAAWVFFHSLLGAIGWQPEAPEAGVSVPRTGSQAAILLEGHCFSKFPQLSCRVLWTETTAKDFH